SARSPQSSRIGCCHREWRLHFTGSHRKKRSCCLARFPRCARCQVVVALKVLWASQHSMKSSHDLGSTFCWRRCISRIINEYRSIIVGASVNNAVAHTSISPNVFDKSRRILRTAACSSPISVAADGLPMGTRPGQLDPGVVLYLIEKNG